MAIMSDVRNLTLSGEVTTAALVSTILGLILLAHFYRNRKLPPGPYGLPWIGYLPFLRKSPHVQLAQLAKRYGNIMSFTVMGKTLIHLNTLDLIKEAFLLKSEDFSGRDPTFSIINFIEDGKAITQTEGKVWKEQRQFFLQVIRKFGYGKLSLEGHIHETICNLIQSVKDSAGKPFDIHVPLSTGTSNVICKLLMNKEFTSGDKEFNSIVQALKTVMEYYVGLRVFLTGFAAKLIYPFLDGNKKLEDGKSLLHRTVAKIISQHEQTFDKNHIRDFTDCYLEELQKSPKSNGLLRSSFSKDTLHANDVNFLMEGTESTSLTIYRMIRQIMKYPEAQKRIQKELDDVVGLERPPSWADRIKLPYTEATLLELQRLAIPFPLSVFHSNPSETTLGGYRIPKRSMIIPNFWSVHMDPKLFPNPEKFDPNRFLNAEGKCEKKDGPFIFGLGKRACPGEALAVMEIFLFITCLLQKFTFSDPGNNDPDQVNYELIAIPRSQ